MADKHRASEIEKKAEQDADNGRYNPPTVTAPVLVLNEATTTRETTEKKTYDDAHSEAKATRGW